MIYNIGEVAGVVEMYDDSIKSSDSINEAYDYFLQLMDDLEIGGFEVNCIDSSDWFTGNTFTYNLTYSDEMMSINVNIIIGFIKGLYTDDARFIKSNWGDECVCEFISEVYINRLDFNFNN